MNQTTPCSVPQPGKQVELTIEDVEALARRELGQNATYERVHVFALTFFHSREIDRHMRDMSGMLRDVERLNLWLTQGAKNDVQRAVWTAAHTWITEEMHRHQAAVLRLRGDIESTRATCQQAADAGERCARPTYGIWLEVARK